VAECAILTGYMANLLHTRQWPDGQFDLFFSEKAELVMQGWEEIHPRLVESAGRVAAVIAALTEDDLAVEIETPFRTQTIEGWMTYPHWNLIYHEGQINYIASLLGTLE